MNDWLMRILGTAHELIPDDQRLYLKSCNLAVEPPTLEVTKVAADARGFANAIDVLECWKTVSSAAPRRIDGKPNRPLSAFSIMAERRDAPNDHAQVIVPRVRTEAEIAAEYGPRPPGQSVAPTPWAVTCPTHGIVFLTQSEFRRQLLFPGAINGWRCPACGGPAEFDDANYAARQTEDANEW